MQIPPDALVPAWFVRDSVGVPAATLRSWVHRGKLEQHEVDREPRYRWSEVVCLLKARRAHIDGLAK